MRFLPNNSIQRRGLLFLLLVVLVGHFFLLISDSVTWDGWIFYGLFLNQDFSTLLSLFRENGDPLVAFFLATFWIFPNPILAYKIFAFFCILSSSSFLFLTAIRISALTIQESMFLAMFSCVYTSYQTYSQVATLHYLFFYTVFMLGIYLLFLGLDNFLIEKKLFSLFLLLIFFFSFQLNSLLVIYYPIFFVFLFKYNENYFKRENISDLFRRNLKFLDFLLLPFVFWGVKNIFFYSFGAYEGYNKIQFNPQIWYENINFFLLNSIKLQFFIAWNLFVGEFLNHKLIIFIIIACSFLGIQWIINNWIYPKNMQENAEVMISRSKVLYDLLVVFAFAFILFLSSIFPYIAVGKYPGNTGSDTRHALLISIPVAIFLVFIGRIFSLVFPDNIGKLTIRFSSFFLLIMFIFLTINIYVEWESRWIRDRSIMLNLQKMNSALIQRMNIFFVSDSDRFGDPYNIYEYSGMFKLAWGSERWAGIELMDEQTPGSALEVLKKTLSRNSLKIYLLKDWHPHGCHSILDISTRISQSHLYLVLTYYKYLWFQHEKLPDFLKSLTMLRLNELPCRQPHNDSGDQGK